MDFSVIENAAQPPNSRTGAGSPPRRRNDAVIQLLYETKASTNRLWNLRLVRKPGYYPVAEGVKDRAFAARKRGFREPGSASRAVSQRTLAKQVPRIFRVRRVRKRRTSRRTGAVGPVRLLTLQRGEQMVEERAKAGGSDRDDDGFSIEPKINHLTVPPVELKSRLLRVGRVTRASSGSV